MTEQKTLEVQLQRPDGDWLIVGFLHRCNLVNWFTFDPAYWRAIDRPILGQVFEDHSPDWQPRASITLPNWFSHLLPEGPLRAAVASAAGVHSTREFDLISRLGESDLPGGLRVLPVDGRVQPNTAELLDQDEQRDVSALKFSLAGAQLKFSAFADHRGLTVPARGVAGNVILKFPDARPGFSAVPQAELGALKLAAAVGVKTAEAELIAPKIISGLPDFLPVDLGPALAVPRFDRKADARIHMEELAQILQRPTTKNNAKYSGANFETIAVLVSRIAGVATVPEIIDRIVLNVLIGNGDAHLKNWALIYPDGYRAELSPAYDILPTVLYLAEDNLGLNLNGSKAFESVTVDSFRSLGEKSGFGGDLAVAQARAAAMRVREHWNLLRDYLKHEQFTRLTARLKKLPLGKD